ncbi:MAG: hypothetical protein E7369_04040 [Clostridiales bacterium]|nr:hypothetical protein [Clostridiales bacterium]
MDILQLTDKFYKNFKGEKFIIGRSVNLKPIYAFKVKKTPTPKLIVQYGIHAREYITCYLALKQITHFLRRGKKGTVYFIPMLNPDGVEIALTKSPTYKANARGVDLNVNFDARWGQGEQNVFYKGSQNFVGEYPFSEPEASALKDFTLRINPNITLSYHSKGEEIYWQFGQTGDRLDRDFAIAKKISAVTGYTIKPTPKSCGGYKDWCIESLKIPSFTIEVGSDKLTHPIGKRHLHDIYRKNRKVITLLTEI